MLLLAAMSAARAEAPAEPPGYRPEDYRAPVPATVAGGRAIGTVEAEALWRDHRALFVDVLPAPRRPEGMRPDAVWLPKPRLDIPGSLWLPDIGRGVLSAELDRWFRDRLTQATGGDLGKPVVFYCLAQCWMSWNATKRAASYGYRQAIWYPDGTDGWGAADLPLMAAQAEPSPG
jgi:PQQ-dependent catabolism-associated CXXCW motif protein